MNETYTTVTGNIVGGVNRRQLADGTSVASFRIASNERRWNRATGAWGDGDHLYLSVTCWRRLADNVAESFSGGDPVIVHGRLYTRDYEKDGNRNWITELEALAVGPDLTRCTAAVTRHGRASQAGGEGATAVPSQARGESVTAASGPSAAGQVEQARAVAPPVEAAVGV